MGVSGKVYRYQEGLFFVLLVVGWRHDEWEDLGGARRPFMGLVVWTGVEWMTPGGILEGSGCIHAVGIRGIFLMVGSFYWCLGINEGNVESNCPLW